MYDFVDKQGNYLHNQGDVTKKSKGKYNTTQLKKKKSTSMPLSIKPCNRLPTFCLNIFLSNENGLMTQVAAAKDDSLNS